MGKILARPAMRYEELPLGGEKTKIKFIVASEEPFKCTLEFRDKTEGNKFLRSQTEKLGKEPVVVEMPFETKKAGFHVIEVKGKESKMLKNAIGVATMATIGFGMFGGGKGFEMETMVPVLKDGGQRKKMAQLRGNDNLRYNLDEKGMVSLVEEKVTRKAVK